MSKESTACDIRVALYNTSKGKAANVLFYNDTELLLDCTRVKLIRDESRLYFHRGDLVKDSLKLSGRHCNILQLNTDYSKVKDLEGEYDIKYDSELDLYYIDKQEKLGEYKHKTGSYLGIKHPGYLTRTQEPRGEYIMTATLKDNAKKMVENSKKQEAEKSTTVNTKTAATTVVVKALISLLRLQVEGNDDALSTIDALETYIY